MKKFLAIVLAVLTLCAAAGCSSKKEDKSSAAATTATTTEEPTTAPGAQISAADSKIRTVLEGLKDMDFSGIIYAERNGKPVATYANGTLTDDTSLTLETPMPVGSVSKQFCAAAIMLLQEQGKLSVNDTLDKYFPEYKESSKITLHDMLANISGIPNFPTDEKDAAELSSQISLDNTDKQNTEALKKWLFKQPLRHDPGKTFAYSNNNFILLGNIVEQVSGKVYIEFLRESFFKPLGMLHTGSIFELKDSPDWAKSFHYEPSELRPGIEPGFAKGAGDIISTAADMTLWMNMLPSGKILSKDSYKAMTTSYSGEDYGYGLYTNVGGDGIGHFGAIGHFTSVDCFVPDKKVTIFVAVNAGGESAVSNNIYPLLDAIA